MVLNSGFLEQTTKPARNPSPDLFLLNPLRRNPHTQNLPISYHVAGQRWYRCNNVDTALKKVDARFVAETGHNNGHGFNHH